MSQTRAKKRVNTKFTFEIPETGGVIYTSISAGIGRAPRIPNTPSEMAHSAATREDYLVFLYRTEEALHKMVPDSYVEHLIWLKNKIKQQMKRLDKEQLERQQHSAQIAENKLVVQSDNEQSDNASPILVSDSPVLTSIDFNSSPCASPIAPPNILSDNTLSDDDIAQALALNSPTLSPNDSNVSPSISPIAAETEDKLAVQLNDESKSLTPDFSVLLPLSIGFGTNPVAAKEKTPNQNHVVMTSSRIILKELSITALTKQEVDEKHSNQHVSPSYLQDSVGSPQKRKRIEDEDAVMPIVTAANHAGTLFSETKSSQSPSQFLEEDENVAPPRSNQESPTQSPAYKKQKITNIR